MSKKIVTIQFNNNKYTAKYNEATDEYELELEAPDTGGIYNVQVEYTNGYINDSKNLDIRILKEIPLKILTEDAFMHIFDYRDFTVKDVVQLYNYEINIDEETNANTTAYTTKKTNATKDDIVFIKEDNEILFWGVIDDIQNENGASSYQYILKYITNMFDEKIALKQRGINDEEIEEGYYTFYSKLNENKVIDVADNKTAAGTNVQLYDFNNTTAQKFIVTKNNDGSYKIAHIKSKLVLDVENGEFANGTNIQIYTSTENNKTQEWKIEKVEDRTYTIFNFSNEEYCIDVDNAKTDNRTNVQLWKSNSTNSQKWEIERCDEEMIREVGIEDYIAHIITKNFINTDDAFLNKNYLKIRNKTHTKLNASVSTIVDVQENLYNFHTFLTNCTQNYNINFNFDIVDKMLELTIENKELKKELIDVNAQPISEYSEVFERTVIAKVVVVTKREGNYNLYLKTDRTTTEDVNDPNRAQGKTETVYSETMEDANQKALDTLKSNSYNHNVTFKYYNRNIKVGTPITIKTKDSLIYDTYISAVTRTYKDKFFKYTCGNIRTDFIDKLLKERKK